MGPREHETGQEECLLRSQTDCVHGRWPLLLGDPIGLRSDELWREGVHRRWYSVPQPKAVRTRTEHVVISRLLICPGHKLKSFLFIEKGNYAESPLLVDVVIANVTRYVFLRRPTASRRCAAFGGSHLLLAHRKAQDSLLHLIQQI